MHIAVYSSPLPAQWMVPGSFVDRNPNLCYLLTEGNHAVLIDACSSLDEVMGDLLKGKLRLDTLLITHYHDDHTFALGKWIGQFPDLMIGVPAASLADFSASGIATRHLVPLTDGQTIAVGKHELQVLATPGHTSDSLCFWDEKDENLFTGDAILGGSLGCSDYRRGGNRNIYYQTIVRLLKSLPRSTKLYPGHLSEHYETPPPYLLSVERKKDPYLANALAGKKGNFDRALKYFSLEFETAEAVMMDTSSLDEICRLEQEIWVPELQASREVIQRRLEQGHRLLSIKEGSDWVGMVGWCYSPFSIEESPDRFPRNFQEFSNCNSCCRDNARSAFIYNVGVRPVCRRKGKGSLLLQETFEKIRKDGITQVFIDSRMPSYRGSEQFAQETIHQQQAFREGIDNYFKTGHMPEDAILASDPTVKFYMKNGCSPWIVRQNFIPDAASGNMRVICFTNLHQDIPLSADQQEE